MLSRRKAGSNTGSSRITVIIMFASIAACSLVCDQVAVAATVPITLSALTSPSNVQAGVTVVNVIGSNFPGGTIAPSAVTLTLTPLSGAPTSTTATAIALVTGSTRRVTFQVPASVVVSTPTNYHVSLAGTTIGGVSFQSVNTATMKVNPPAKILTVVPSSGQPGQSESVTLTGQYTNFLQGATLANFGSGISVGQAPAGTFGPLTVTSPTAAIAQIVIASSATPGRRSVSIQTGAQVATAPQGFSVTGAENGVLVGTVVSDLTGLPYPGAGLQVLGRSGEKDVSDAAGRYSIPATDVHLFLQITQLSTSGNGLPIVVPVEREVFVQSGTGTVPVDARLTPLASPVVVDSTGGALNAAATNIGISIAIAPGAVASPTAFHLTPLSSEGLPNLLPLGWSPVSAFDWRGDTATNAIGAVSFTGLPQTGLQLVSYSTAVHGWIMVAASLTPFSDGTLSANLPSTGSYALVVPDVGSSINVPAPGQLLTGVKMVPLASDAVSTGTLIPSALGPGGGTSQALLTIQSSMSAPSGTVIQSSLTEKYSLTSGASIVEQSRLQDIVFYQYGAPSGSILAAQLPVTPSHTFQPAQLISGELVLDILAGRESVRGQTGGTDAVVVQSGSTTLTVTAGSLPENTAISVNPMVLDTFLPSSATATPITEVTVDFSGEVLTSSAQLSVDGAGVQPTDNVVVAYVDRFMGVPRLEVVALAQLVGTKLFSRPYPGLRGITQGGEYVFYRVASRLGFMSGTTTANGAPIPAVVSTNTLPFIGLANNQGRYTVAALPGTINASAAVPGTNLTGSGSAQVAANQTSPLDIALTGVVTSATVLPADGAVAVPVDTQITISTTAPVNPAYVNSKDIQLHQGTTSSGVTVPLQFVITLGGIQVSAVPQQALLPGQQYTFTISGLADIYGGLVSPKQISFTTAFATAPTLNTNQISFSYPDANGNVQVTAPAGSLPPGTTVLIVNLGSGQVIEFTVANDGSLSVQIRATISDVLQVTVTDPFQNTVTFQKGQYVAPDGSVGVGSAGGTISGTGGVQLQIPQGALTHGVTLKVQSFDATVFPERPDLPNATFGGGLQITSSDMPTFQKEVKLVFPKPNAPDGAFYYVYRRLQGSNGQVIFETIDHAFVQGQASNATVVTASYPFLGYVESVGAVDFSPIGQIIGVETNATINFFLMWTYSGAAPNVAALGIVTGVVQQAYVADPPANAAPKATCPVSHGATLYCPLYKVPVAFADAQGNPIPAEGVAETGPDGRYTLFNSHYLDTTAVVTATVGGVNQSATAYNFAVSDGIDFPWLVPLFSFYPQIADANITFPTVQPPPRAPKAQIVLFKSDANGNRQTVSGITTVGTPLIIGFKSTTSLPLTLNPNQYTIQAIIQTTGGQSTPLSLQSDPAGQMDLIAYFTPSQSGSYTIELTVTPYLGNSAQFTSSFLAVSNPGQANNNVLPGQAPRVISIAPSDGETDVEISTLPEIVFNQPVLNAVSGYVSLKDNNGNVVPIRISAIGVNGQPISNPTAATPVTSITLIPQSTINLTSQSNLKFSTTYIIGLSAGITNADPQNPVPMSATSYSFTTLAPENVNDTSAFPAVGLLVLGNRVYIPERNQQNIPPDGTLHAFDISDPSTPREFADGVIHGSAIDISGEQNSPVVTYSESIQLPPANPVPGNLIVVGVSHLVPDGPSNLWLFQDSVQETGALNPTGLQPIGAMSLTGSMEKGTVIRVAVKGQFAYTITRPYGIQVVDLNHAAKEFTDAINGQNNWNVNKMNQALTLPGAGFARDTVVNTIPMGVNPDGSGQFQQMSGLVVSDFILPDQSTQTLAIATGKIPLFVANPGSGQVLFRDPTQLVTAQGSLTSGWALALGSIGDTCQQGGVRTFAVVAGTGTAPDPSHNNALSPAGSPVVAFIDLCNPATPNPVGFFLLSAAPTDVKTRGSLAYVATSTQVVIIDFSDPSMPKQIGTFDESAEYNGAQAPVFGHIALADDDLVLSTSLDNTYGGLHINATGPVEESSGTGGCVPCLTGECEDACESGVGAPPRSNFAGGITITNGNTWIQQEDYRIPGLGGGLELSRTWNSRWRDVGPPLVIGMFGDGWHSSVEEKITFSAATQTTTGNQVTPAKAKLWRGDGSAWTFNYDKVKNIFVLADPVTARAKFVYDPVTHRSTITFKDGTQELFDNNGFLLSQTDRNGNTTTYVYDGSNRLTAVTSAGGQSITFAYKGSNPALVSQVTDTIGPIASYAYDSYGRLTQVSYPDQTFFTFNYDINSMLTSVLDANGKTVQTYMYDSSHRGTISQRASGTQTASVAYPSPGAAQVTDSNGNVTNYTYSYIGNTGFLQSTNGPGCETCGAVPGSAKYSYDAAGNLAGAQDANGNTVTRTYDALGNVASRTVMLNGTAITYNYTYSSFAAFSELLTATDPLGNKTTNTYDANGNLLSTTNPAGTTNFAFDPKGQLIKITDPNGNATARTYTNAGLLASTTDALNNVTQYTYDARGFRTSVTDALKNVTIYTPDLRNRLRMITYPDGSTTSYTYDARGRRASVTDGNGKTTTYTYDDADHLVSVTDAAKHATQYAYNSEGNLSSVTDALLRTTSYTYDTQRRLSQTKYPSGLVETYTYDAVGNRTSKTDRKGQKIQYGPYDALNRLTLKTYPDGTTVTYTYDNDSRLKQVQDASGTYGFSYDGVSRLTGTTTRYSFLPNKTFTMSYGYDFASNRTSFVDAEGGSNSYSYTHLNQLQTITDFNGNLFTFTYDQLGRESTRARPNGVTTTYNYDSLSRLQNILHQANGNTFDGAAYTYDFAGNRTSKTNYLDGSVSNYTYDPTYQLKLVTQGSNTTESYSYDAVGNRLSSLNVASYAYDNSNHLMSSSDGTSYAYDNDGNTTSKTDAGGTTTSNWDFENRPRSVSLPDSSAVTFTYDPFGRRVQKSSTAGTLNYLYDGINISEELDQNGSSIARYTQRGQAIDRPLSVLRSGSISYYEVDGLGSATSLSNGVGAITNSWSYDSFGNITTSTGPVGNSIQFTGRPLDSETDLYFYRARYYNAMIGRFVSEDPSGLSAGSQNFYTYVSNNPSTDIDPGGLGSWREVGDWLVRIETPVVGKRHAHIKGANRSNRRIETQCTEKGELRENATIPVPRDKTLLEFLRSRGFNVAIELMNAYSLYQDIEQIENAPDGSLIWFSPMVGFGGGVQVFAPDDPDYNKMYYKAMSDAGIPIT